MVSSLTFSISCGLYLFIFYTAGFYSLSSVQSLSHVWLFATPWTAAHQAPCPSTTPGVYPNSCPWSWWCHPTISSSVIPFFFFPASGSFPMSQLFPSGGQSIWVSASTSVLPVNTQDWYPLGWTGWISLQSRACRGPAPVDPGNSKRGGRRRGSGNNCLIKH